ncbi:DUF445 domain-containing protein [Streptomyces fuscigenes]|uniref:DUF445 domain-containing protein n=1 Tax=Streptomyces fuscigenes TaxID=1528880 RepID=UPI001F1AF149|nr:DUF445 domain-containing protein [Streptomyces fuscigenes]MCF3962251.1 DUF445 domain-containing protein [Streptomyces fuscigenes]
MERGEAGRASQHVPDEHVPDEDVPGGAGRADGASGARGTDSGAGAGAGAGAGSGSGCRTGSGPGPRRLAAGGGGGGGLPSFSYTAADEEKRRGVRRMKTTASALLVFVAAVYALTTWGRHEGAGGWAGYVAAAAEAGMVGALADWFAVTALFRHPLGLPIPHTAIIPNKKDQLGASLAQFVGENFLSADVVRARLRALGIGRRVGAWLAEPEHAERVTAEAATALRGAITVLRDSDVQAVVGEAITRRADAAEIAPVIGKTLNRVVADGAHHRAVDLVCARGRDWLIAHEDSVMDAVQGGAPGWTPRFVDRRIGERVYKELLRFVTEMRDMPAHPARGAIDRFLRDFASDLQSDTETRTRIERLKSDLIARPEVQDIIASAWSSLRSMIISAAEDDSSELRTRARTSLLALGRRLATDERLQDKLEGWIEDAASYVVSTYRGEITSLITDTVKSWNADDTSKKIEAHIGRDLQFIRINGTVVGALAGLLIYTVSHALGA